MSSRTRSRRAPRKHRAAWWTGGAVAAVVATLAVLYATRSTPAPSRDAKRTAFPFPCLQAEGEAQHIHPYLRVLIDGQPVPIPALVGIRSISKNLACLEPVHTHDASGIIHIESPDPGQIYTLADFFAIWRATYPLVEIGGARYPVGYALTELLGHRTDAHHVIRLLIDGTPSLAGPALVLNTLDYCSIAMAGPPCAPTAVTDPYPPFLVQQYGVGHTIALEYARSPRE